MFLQFMRGQVDEVMATTSGQQQLTGQVLDTIKGFVPKVQGSWIGGDEVAFGEDVAREIVPAMLELIAAIAGININLTSATGIIDQADSKAQGMASQLGDLFGGI